MEFDDFSYDKILEKEGISLSFDDKDDPYWRMHWRHGDLFFYSLFKVQDEEKAKMASALYAYLLSKNVDPYIAQKSAEAYVSFWTIKKLEKKK